MGLAETYNRRYYWRLDLTCRPGGSEMGEAKISESKNGFSEIERNLDAPTSPHAPQAAQQEGLGRLCNSFGIVL